MDISIYQERFHTYLQAQDLDREPKNLYQPMSYILQLGGKRIRPVLTLMAADLFAGNYNNALPAAFAVEVFHNFTLVHDDIMDDAPLRRGATTIHEKWNLNTGILSGDAMLILAYQYFENYPPVVFQRLAKLFSKTALEVCDGQQLDVDFETRNDVTIPEYIHMISLKTSVLVAAALKMGAIVADVAEDQAQHLYNYGLDLGIAFQLQDDYLDTYGDPETFGKQVGGDIIENKKTYLYLKTLALASPEDVATLHALYAEKRTENTAKIATVKAIFTKNNIAKHLQEQIALYTQKAFESIEKLTIASDKKQQFITFGNNLMSRDI